MSNLNSSRRFEPGQIVATRGALALLGELRVDPLMLLARHLSGDWGDIDKEDQDENERSVDAGYRILSAYVLAGGQKIWVLSEADRSATTLLLPEEY